MSKSDPRDSTEQASERTVITQRKLPIQRENALDREASLVVIYGTDLGRRIPLGEAPIEAGRSAACGIPVDQESVSRHHARIWWTGKGYRVKDLGSTNGTYVNDVVITEHELADGDQIKIGPTILKFMYGGNIEASYHEEIYRMMTFDGLTQIYNKRYFHETLEREISRSRRYSRDLGLVLFDIDHFKLKNDSFGHLAGDFILKELSSLVRAKLRREDVFARVGGEEFGILTPEVGMKGSREVAEKVRLVVEATTFRFEKNLMPTTISLGVAVWLKGDDSAEALYKRADVALYAAKAAGRNRVEQSDEG